MRQSTIIVEIRTLFAWLKSTLLPKIECRETLIYLKMKCLQTKWDKALFWVESDREKSVGTN
jgi:hypothetical protein